MRKIRWLFAALFALAVLPASTWAQQPATVTGRVTDAAGAPVSSASVFIQSLNVGTLTRENGTYTLIVPASRVRTGPVQLTAQSIGYRSETVPVSLQAGGTVSRDFSLGLDVLELEGIVAVGQGITQERRALASTVNTVKSEEITQSREMNVVSALAGKAPNVQVTTSSGEPGAGAYIRIRGGKTINGDGQPLIVVDGVPIDNRSIDIENEGNGAPGQSNNTSGTVVSNRAADVNPNDIASVEILKGPAAAAIYGSRAANGVVLITTKSGQSGQSRVTYGFQYSVDDVNQKIPLQTRFGQGRAQIDGDPNVTVAGGIRSWGGPLPASTPTFSHADELFDTGRSFENNLTMSGGSERTTYYLSLGRMDQDGVFKGPNNQYVRNTVRLKGDHRFMDNLKIGGNFAYAEADMRALQTGSNISGLQLGALRTPPEYDNCRQAGGYDCYLDPNGLHHSYRRPNPTLLAQSRGFDNPFWVLFEMPNTSDVGRFFGNVNLDFQPLPWLNLSYILGADYAADERLTVIPKGSSDFPNGRMIRADLISEQYDSNLLLTLNYAGDERLNGSLTLGQNLNQQEFSRYQVNGQTLIFGTDQLDFTVDRIPNEYREKVRTDGYFAQANVNLWQQLFLTGALRLDGSSTFGGTDTRFLYPKASAAYDFSRLAGLDRFLNFGKLRFAYGVAGVQPPVYSSTSAFATGTVTDGWISPNGLETIYAGFDGVQTQLTQGNAEIEPEKTREWEAGFDLAVLDNRVALSVTYYDQHTTDAILQVPVAPSTGFNFAWRNAAEFENSGWEATLDVVPVQMRNFGWNIGLQYARNESCVLDLAGAESAFLNGFSGGLGVELAAPDPDTGECYPFGVFITDDFIRFGNGSTSDEGVDIDAAFPGTPAGTLFVGPDGFPQYDGQLRVTGAPDPDWTGSVRNTFTLGQNLRISGLIDISRGNQMLNGTRGALYSYGTHKDTEAWHAAGKDTIFPGVGPGAGQSVNLNWRSWGELGLGNSFTGPSAQFIEDASFVKLRDISVSYTLAQPWLERVGFTTAEISVAGRNLKTWTDYRGIDPESNLTGQSLGRGIDYFNNPRTRSFVFGVNLSR